MKIRGMGIVLTIISIVGMLSSCEFSGNYKMDIKDVFLTSNSSPGNLIETRIKKNKTNKDCKYTKEQLEGYLRRNNIEWEETSNSIKVKFDKNRDGIVGFTYKFNESYKQDKWKENSDDLKWTDVQFEILFSSSPTSVNIEDYKEANKVLQILYGIDYNVSEINRLLETYSIRTKGKKEFIGEGNFYLNNGWNKGKFKVEDGIITITDSYTPFEKSDIVNQNYEEFNKLGLTDGQKVKVCQLDNLSIYSGATETLGVTKVGSDNGVIIDNSKFKYVIREDGVDNIELLYEAEKDSFKLINNEEMYQALNIYLDSNKETLDLFTNGLENAIDSMKEESRSKGTINKNSYIMEYNVDVLEKNMNIIQIRAKVYKVTL